MFLQDGRLTVNRIRGRHLAEPKVQEACRRSISELIDDHTCEILAVDLMDVTPITSWVLGILAAVRRRGIAVELYHPSAVIREILQTTHMNDILHVRHDEARPDQYSKLQ